MTLQGSKRLPGCGHVFHKSCLREWLVQQQTCPTCRGDITAMEARQRQQQRLEQAAQEHEEQEQAQAAAAAAAEPPADAAPAAAPVQQQRGMPELQPEPTTTFVSPKKRVRIQTSAFVFPSLYRVASERGANVWNEAGFVHRTVPCGVAILCTELQWMSFNGTSGMMLRMPDGWVREDAVERLHSVRLPINTAPQAACSNRD
jgi:E3 ubiquitin-protein ligase synoviolin